MTIQRMEHAGIVFHDLAGAIDFFVEVRLLLRGQMPVEGHSVDRIVGLEGVRVDTAMMQTPNGTGQLELITFYSRPSDDVKPHDVRRPEEMIIELAERIG